MYSHGLDRSRADRLGESGDEERAKEEITNYDTAKRSISENIRLRTHAQSQPEPNPNSPVLQSNRYAHPFPFHSPEISYFREDYRLTKVLRC